MSNANQSYDPGIVSLSGFAYQIKVFILLFASLQIGERIEFETLDDIAIQSIAQSDANNDLCLKTKTDSENTVTVFQVKQTNVSAAKSRNILYNWLLALNKNRNISKFTLYIDDGYSASDAAFISGYAKEYATIIDSNKEPAALITKVKSIYGDNEELFKKDYNFVVGNYCIKPIQNIDSELINALSTSLHFDANSIGPVYAKQRLEELFTRVCARIMTSISERKPFYSSREEIMQICDEICRNICPSKYAPDYSSFERLHSFTTISADVQTSRAYKQLQYCNLGIPDTMKHLLWQQYYTNIRHHYLLDAQQSTVDAIEDIASENHKDVVRELQEDGIDTPRRRLTITKRQTINALNDEHSRWGAYVFLTNDTGDKQISWKDDENEKQ